MYQLGPGPYPEDLGIVENGDKATHAISQGQYVIWKGVLKKAKEAIQVTGDLSSTNLANVANGLGGEVKSLSDQIGNLFTNVDISAAFSSNVLAYTGLNVTTFISVSGIFNL